MTGERLPEHQTGQAAQRRNAVTRPDWGRLAATAALTGAASVAINQVLDGDGIWHTNTEGLWATNQSRLATVTGLVGTFTGIWGVIFS